MTVQQKIETTIIFKKTKIYPHYPDGLIVIHPLRFCNNERNCANNMNMEQKIEDSIAQIFDSPTRKYFAKN